MISKKDVQHIAKLARLGITPEEEEKFAKELFKILDYIEKLKEVDVSKVEPTSHSLLVKNVMRSDEEIKKQLEGAKLMELAPETKGGYLKVKKII